MGAAAAVAQRQIAPGVGAGSEVLVQPAAARTGSIVRCRVWPIGARLGAMSDADLAEILKLPVEEWLRLVELLWESLRKTPNELPLSDAHRTALDTELADHQRDPTNVLTLEEVLSGIRKPQ